MPDRGKSKSKRPVAGAVPHLGRQPQLGATPKPEKRPFAAAPSVNDSRVRVAWRFQRLDPEGPWPWHFADDAKSTEVHQKLSMYEGKTWEESAGKRGHKRIPVENLCDEAQKRLTKLDLGDVDALWEMHLSGAERVWGIRWENICYLLWWDPGHEVCPSARD